MRDVPGKQINTSGSVSYKEASNFREITYKDDTTIAILATQLV